MKEFRTELFPQDSVSPIGLKDNIFTIGSCFADEIAERLIENKFNVWNYFGTVYNPISIHELLTFALQKEFPITESYSNNDEVYFNYHFHSSFSSLNRKDLEHKIQTSIGKANAFLKNVDRIIMTYGTSFVYKLKEKNRIVANCHKMPSSIFKKELLIETEIINSFEKFYAHLKSANPACKIILTVSPVRHLKDTLELNSVSKSILRTACHSIQNNFKDIEYFPAYEILLDDLRDYRFYKTDQLHPTEEAVEYIWEKFIEAYFDGQSKKFVNEWKMILKGLQHRPFNFHSKDHQKFLKQILTKLEKLQPMVDVSAEIKNLKSYLLNHTS